MFKKTARLCALAVAMATAAPTLAHAGPLPPGTPSDVFATGGEVFATFLGREALYTSDTYFFGTAYPTDLSSPTGGQFLFTNNTTPVNTQVSLGVHSAYTPLIFGLYVHQLNRWYFTGTGAYNPSNQIHAMLTNGMTDGNPSVEVGFEDLCRPDAPCENDPLVSDWDYNDHRFNLVNATATPEPVSMALMGTGLAGIAGIARRRRKNREQEA